MDLKINQEIVEHLVKNNGEFYNLHKASEELLELALILNQKLLKPKNINEQQIIDELGDVEIRMSVLRRLFPQDKVQERIQKKEADYLEWINKGTYKKI